MLTMPGRLMSRQQSDAEESVTGGTYTFEDSTQFTFEDGTNFDFD